MIGKGWSLVLIFFCMVTSAYSAVAESASSQNVEFRSEGVSLEGTLFFPDDAAPRVVLVLLHGSARKDSLRMNALARALANDGFAVLTYDKRGIGASEGVFQDGNSEAALTLLARDAVAAVDVVATSPRLRRASIGLLGISQGGWVGPLAATRSKRIAFMLLWSGPVCTLGEEVHFSRFAKDIPNFEMHEYSSEAREHMRAAPKLMSDFDPIPVLQNVSVPTLWVFGARDSSIPVQLSMERLDGLIKGGKRNFEYRLLPDGEHALNYPDQAALDWMRKQA